VRHLSAWLLILLLGLTSAGAVRASPADVEVVVNASRVYYRVGGITPEAIDADMAQHGPPDSADQRWWAITYPLYDWRFPCQCDGGGCVTGPVTIYVNLEYVLPLWYESASAPPALVERWNVFFDALRTHEAGHGEVARACGQRLGEAYLAIPPQPSCDALHAAVTATSGQVFVECRADQAGYEAGTAHGRTQGVIWP
jgi:predicted secreted Zn-dependent protease